MRKDSLSDLEPKKIARLVGITLEAEDPAQYDGDRQIAESLASRLEAPWRNADGRNSPWPAMIARLLGAQRRALQPPLGGQLLDAQTKLGTIKAIRRYAKEEAAHQSDEAEHAAMTTIYFAAIASALAFHETKITTYSHESLRSSFAKLLAKSWMPEDLKGLFAKAVEVCQQQS